MREHTRPEHRVTARNAIRRIMIFIVVLRSAMRLL
jgi:hypothetical protein